MTNDELVKCKALTSVGINHLKDSKELEKESKDCYANNNMALGELKQMKSDQLYGCALGIHLVLATLGYEDDSMDELSKLL